MTDIVERLRNRNNPENRWMMMTEAANEIEQLRAALSKARWHLNRYNQPDALLAIKTALEPKP